MNKNKYLSDPKLVKIGEELEQSKIKCELIKQRLNWLDQERVHDVQDVQDKCINETSPILQT
jgi:hypothetical protein